MVAINWQRRLIDVGERLVCFLGFETDAIKDRGEYDIKSSSISSLCSSFYDDLILVIIFSPIKLDFFTNERKSSLNNLVFRDSYDNSQFSIIHKTSYITEKLV
jgi:hypothetical protein